MRSPNLCMMYDESSIVEEAANVFLWLQLSAARVANMRREVAAVVPPPRINQPFFYHPLIVAPQAQSTQWDNGI